MSMSFRTTLRPSKLIGLGKPRLPWIPAFSGPHAAHGCRRYSPQAPAAGFEKEKGDKRSVVERMSLKGKTTVITGGARGIGLAIAEAAAEAGSDVAILDVLEKPQKNLGKYYRCVSIFAFMFNRTFNDILF